MIRSFGRRGQPLAVLALVLGSWISARVMMWDASAMPAAGPALPQQMPLSSAAVSTAVGELAVETALAPAPLSRAAVDMVPKAARSVAQTAGKLAGKFGAATAYAPIDREAVAAYDYQAPPATMPTLASRPRGGQSMGRLVPAKFAYAAMPRASGPIVFGQPYAAPSWASASPPGLAAEGNAHYPPGTSSVLASVLFPTAPGSPYVYNASAGPAQPARARHWSMDSWYYWRRGSTAGLSQGAFAPSYGASQAGAVLRYRIAPASAYKPTVFLRTTAALNGSGEREVALGLSARPVPRVPVVVAGEARYSQTPDGREVRPAGFAYTELPPFKLPLGLRGEAYAQGGYVGGRNATLFVDGSLRADHRLLKPGRAEVRVGGGLWGGAQKGAARLDAGPSVIVVTPLSDKLSARLAADWRFRVAGDAAPDSGPAVTLSAGF